MWIRLDTRRSANGEREGAPLAISAASAATDFTLATRRAALSRLVESARALVLMLAEEYTPVGPSSNIAPLTGGSQKSATLGGA
jgi:hypothetical protein